MSTLKPKGLPLTSDGLATVCDKLGVMAAEIWAVIFTETDPPYGGFWSNARPQILYERHIFSRLTNHRYDAQHPDISNPVPGGYGPSGQHQYDRLSAAIALDSTAALMSPSWGIGQTLGENYRECGFPSPLALVTSMFDSEDQQLLAAANEMISSHSAAALAAHDWKTFARIYNGPGYARNHYDVHLSSWYAKLNSGALPDLHVRAAQMYLLYLGFDPSTIDGLWGERSRSAMNQYQQQAHLPTTDELDDPTFAKLQVDAQAAVAAASNELNV
jgi:hypothetical protein